ncbi:unnamed protein product [Vitrella brassicaformis CCMP3155]|uniref:Uncharacterized protein n=1 Tax=Vitrella brassicaformis (strain CCMP3155) TaxID=1169540 RepID=A0A0G4GZX9_VITBC|nr:unnamed protein product [Vitrella brassicaformis CCMP3155]|eukprot:CEM36845.1 unnamed protein product [Vitrella brassicaformis CCMP3155]
MACEPEQSDRAGQSFDLSNDEHYAVLYGRAGATKAKLARLSGAGITMMQERRKKGVSVFGTQEQRDKAIFYMKVLLATVGAPMAKGSDVAREIPMNYTKVKGRTDLSLVVVPLDAVSYIVGKYRSTMHKVEEYWDVFMQFASLSKYDPSQPLVVGRRLEGMPEAPTNTDKADTTRNTTIAILGQKRGRLGAEIYVMGAVEKCVPGFYPDAQVFESRFHKTAGFAVDKYVLEDENAMACAVPMLNAVHCASNAVVNHIGRRACYILGTREERRLGKDYIDLAIVHTMIKIRQPRPFARALKERGFTLDGREDMTRHEFVGYCNLDIVADIAKRTMTIIIRLKEYDRSPTQLLWVFGSSKDNRSTAVSLIDRARIIPSHFTTLSDLPTAPKSPPTHRCTTHSCSSDEQHQSQPQQQQREAPQLLRRSSHATTIVSRESSAGAHDPNNHADSLPVSVATSVLDGDEGDAGSQQQQQQEGKDTGLMPMSEEQYAAHWPSLSVGEMTSEDRCHSSPTRTQPQQDTERCDMSELVSGLLVQLRGRALALQTLTTSAVSLHDQCCDNLKHHQQHNTTDNSDGRVAECVDRVCGVLREANRDEQQLLEGQQLLNAKIHQAYAELKVALHK